VNWKGRFDPAASYTVIEIVSVDPAVTGGCAGTIAKPATLTVSVRVGEVLAIKLEFPLLL
jgi:hypothetical protein